MYFFNYRDALQSLGLIVLPSQKPHLDSEQWPVSPNLWTPEFSACPERQRRTYSHDNSNLNQSEYNNKYDHSSSYLAHPLDVTAGANDQQIRQLQIKIGYRTIPEWVEFYLFWR